MTSFYKHLLKVFHSYKELKFLQINNKNIKYRIYLFAGGQQQKARFNDLFQLKFINKPILDRSNSHSLYVEKVKPVENSLLPSARTYHASSLIRQYMVSIGGEANSDLKDFWAFDLNSNTWFKAEVDFKDYFTPKRFHTISTISDTQIVSFGGCHSEYVHMNEMHIFDLTQFFVDPSNQENRVIAT